MAGIVSNPTTDSVAPITPLEAAKMMHIRMVAIARPPGMRRVQMCIASNSFSAIPDFSSIAPMNTNSGTAANTKLEEMSSIFSMNWKITRLPKIPRPNSTAVIIIANATCTPRNIRPKATGSIRNGR